MNFQQDKVTFIKNIEYGDNSELETYLHKYFNEITAMYNIFKFNSINIIKMDIENQQINFSVVCNELNDAIIIEDHLTICNAISVYGKIYTITITRDDNILYILLSEKG